MIFQRHGVPLKLPLSARSTLKSADLQFTGNLQICWEFNRINLTLNGGDISTEAF